MTRSERLAGSSRFFPGCGHVADNSGGGPPSADGRNTYEPRNRLRPSSRQSNRPFFRILPPIVAAVAVRIATLCNFAARRYLRNSERDPIPPNARERRGGMGVFVFARTPRTGGVGAEAATGRSASHGSALRSPDHRRVATHGFVMPSVRRHHDDRSVAGFRAFRDRTARPTTVSPRLRPARGLIPVKAGRGRFTAWSRR